jgi:hypothetical protein
MYFQWTFNGQSLAGQTSAVLTLPTVTLQSAGEYRLLAYNAFGLAVSPTTDVDVHIPPNIGQQPTNVFVRVPPDSQAATTTNATFYVSAFSRSAVQYQWRFNGANIPGATGSSFTVANVKTNDYGYFTVVVSDGVSVVESQPAWLYPLVRPVILQNPLPQDVPLGARVTLAVEYSGWPPPYAVEWRLGSLPIVTNQENSGVSFFSFNAPSIVVTQQYRAVVKNQALPGGVASAFVRVLVQADADGDGLSDAWETANGLNPGSALDRLGDLDGDGSLNWQEFEAGTDPNNPLSYLRIQGISAVNGARLEFGAVSNRSYRVQYSELPSGGSWQRLADVVGRSTNRTEVILDPRPGTNRFYRVVTPAQ